MPPADPPTADPDAWRAAFTHAPVGLALVSTAGQCIDVNRELCRTLGYTREELLQRTFQDLTHPDDLSLDLDHVEALLRGDVEHYTLQKRYLRRDGSIVPCELSVRLQRDEAGSPLRFVSLVRELDDAGETESLRRRAERLARANDDLEHFTHAASHDLRAPLRTVRNFGGLLEQRCGEELSRAGRGYLEHVLAAAERMDVLLDALVAYSRAAGQELERTEVDLDVELRAALGALRDELEAAGATVEADALPSVHGNAALLRSVLQNLIENAVKYRDPNRAPRIRVDAESTAGEHVIRVHDNGVGVPPDQARRIFRVFQRLHSQDEVPGSGLGLALVDRIAIRHGGRAWIVSTPGVGSTVHVSLPRP